MKINGKITILCDREGATIELHDDDARVTFATVQLNPVQLAQALGRLGYTECESVEVRGLDKVGKKMENKEFVFEVPEDLSWKKDIRDKILIPLLKKSCPKEWVPDTSFSSQGSFFSKDGKHYAKTVIRRWVDIDERDSK